ncbi:hypothetical protein TNCT_560381 [Trichonephila clavata]|uniref:Uncharacterized protein n=1 Tax=Trichonephila clavata TaxID=2740835 RepID=A0A8X6GSF5_TRICU|nr:hypothetical protein TNCT_560381 [Trichonephila clavata]
MFLPPRHATDRPVEEYRTELCIRRPCVLMNAGWSYREPSARCKRWGSIMFITPRHDINRPVEEFRPLYPPTWNSEECRLVLLRPVRLVYAAE